MPNLPLTLWPMPSPSIAPQVYLRLTPFGEGGDDTPPVVTLESPSNGSEIPPGTPVVFTVTDNVFFRVVLVTVKFPGLGTYEVAFDDESGFSYAYAGSTRDTIANGYRFHLYRRQGWPAGEPMLVRVRAVDLDGNEN